MKRHVRIDHTAIFRWVNSETACRNPWAPLKICDAVRWLISVSCVAGLSVASPAPESEASVFSIAQPIGSLRTVDSFREYPRPEVARERWICLNGGWEYCLIGHTRLVRPNAGGFAGKILVPCPIESELSGVEWTFTERECLWYKRTFSVPPSWQRQHVLLHFEAVDWEARVFVNGKELGVHRGGYDSFSFDITDALKPEGEQELLVSVLDPTDAGFQPRGKQSLHPRPPFFSASSGIWQSVWLEPVPEFYIESLKLVPDIDAGVLNVTAFTRGDTNGVTVEAVGLDGSNEVSRATGRAGENFQLAVPNAKLWSPDSPFLYDLKVALLRDGRQIDEVSSYFGMRKISVAKDESGFPRLMLNDKRLFQLGPLDQGYWPDGLYTAPSDDALRHDIEVMKQLGFNMCRKHVKVEPDRWYYWCDRLGLLVWQDIPNGDRPGSMQEKEIRRRPDSAIDFEEELQRIITQRQNHPCIVMWIAFNQAWGQYDTARIVNRIKELDPSRLVIGASGWYDKPVGDVRSLHSYPGPATPVFHDNRACVVGECGGLGLGIPGHMWGAMGTWNTTPFKTVEELTTGYLSLLSKIQELEEKKGLSGAVITQLSDVETECDGFMTYDRAVIKMPVEKVREANERVIHATVEMAK